jgi:hypothetical protein
VGAIIARVIARMKDTAAAVATTNAFASATTKKHKLIKNQALCSQGHTGFLQYRRGRYFARLGENARGRVSLIF